MGVWTFVSPSSLSSPVSQQMDDGPRKILVRKTLEETKHNSTDTF